MERRAIAVLGIVQGVGFRPFICGLASRLSLGGFVKNQTGRVLIEVEGEAPSLDHFLAEMVSAPPPLAQIDHVAWEQRAPQGDVCFRIQPSDAGPAKEIFVSPDSATCAACLAELFDPCDRRYRYPFLNCSHCGPRLTIVTGAPYDRDRTTMRAFPMCAACRAEYEDPFNRRFHAQPTACPACGPRLQFLDAHGQPVATSDPLIPFAEGLRVGQIGALKGLGGYHLACDARNEIAVAELRRRKHRDEKPFAIMVQDLAAAEALCQLAPADADLLSCWRRPIVLLQKRAAAAISAMVAPGNPYLGLMLPYTPLHHLLLDLMAGVPLVMTSGNRSDEPIAYEAGDALVRLSGIADCFLTHDRAIHVRCDDSVTCQVGGLELPLRRSRGHAPQPIPLPLDCPRPILAVGGQLKGTFALGCGRHAFLSHHLGDLDHFDAYRAFVKDIALYQQLLAIEPEVIVHDRHPDYASTRYAMERSTASGPPLLAVQHHYAHVASCMADNGLAGPVIGVAFDGTGYGSDGAIWGGEFLVADYRRFRRAAHLRYVGMPGGERAIREPWRMAVAHLEDAQIDTPLLKNRLSRVELNAVQKMLQRRFNTPQTSSAGRLFDAVASLAGVRDRVNHEGQAAMELEWRALQAAPDGVSYPFGILSADGKESDTTLVIDTRPLIREVARDARRHVDAGVIARRFHLSMIELVVTVCARIARATGLGEVVLSGGVFMNALLTVGVTSRLGKEGFTVYRHRRVPPNDGGLSLGQVAVAAAALEQETQRSTQADDLRR